MSSRCSICQHPQHDAIDVSVLRDGTRVTARRFQISRPSLDRHKKYLSQSVAAADQARGVAASSDGETPLLSQLEVLIRQCEQTLIRATSTKNVSHVMRTLKEIRACLELKVKLETEKPRGVLSGSSSHQGPRLGDADISIRMLQKICWYTKGFHPLKIWHLKHGWHF